jgi:hypothetical protein
VHCIWKFKILGQWRSKSWCSSLTLIFRQSSWQAELQLSKHICITTSFNPGDVRKRRRSPAQSRQQTEKSQRTWKSAWDRVKTTIIFLVPIRTLSIDILICYLFIFYRCIILFQRWCIKKRIRFIISTGVIGDSCSEHFIPRQIYNLKLGKSVWEKKSSFGWEKKKTTQKAPEESWGIFSTTWNLACYPDLNWCGCFTE